MPVVMHLSLYHPLLPLPKLIDRDFFPIRLTTVPLPTDMWLLITTHVHYLPGYISLSIFPRLFSLSLPINEMLLVQVEDIVDSGRTGVQLKEYFSTRGASSIRMVSLLSKPSRREVEFEPDYLGFTIEDEFVVGYGLDIDQELRSLPYIGIV